MSNKKRVLLTGSSGFLGKYFQKEFSMQELVVLNKNSSGDYCVDLSLTVPKFSHKFDLVIHNAGLAHESSGEFQHINVQGTRNLLESLKFSPPSHFVFISSVSVYGRFNGQYLTEKCPLWLKINMGKVRYRLR